MRFLRARFDLRSAQIKFRPNRGVVIVDSRWRNYPDAKVLAFLSGRQNLDFPLVNGGYQRRLRNQLEFGLLDQLVFINAQEIDAAQRQDKNKKTDRKKDAA